MQRPGRCRIRELIDRIDNPTPDRHTGGITSGRKPVGASSAFHQSRIAVAFEHQIRYAPDVDLGYHAAKIDGARLERFKTDNRLV
jgi:hypothetical protein